MGAWGYGYRDNDNYYNLAGGFVEPLFVSLQEAFDEGGMDLQNLRVHLMWTVNLLRETDEEVVLSIRNILALRSFVKYIREIAQDFTDNEEFIEAVEADMKSVKEWLDSFVEVGPLGSRLGSLLETVAEKEAKP